MRPPGFQRTNRAWGTLNHREPIVRCTRDISVLAVTEAHAQRYRGPDENQIPPLPTVGSHGNRGGEFSHPKTEASTSATSRATTQRILQGLTQGGTTTAMNTRAMPATAMTTPESTRAVENLLFIPSIQRIPTSPTGPQSRADIRSESRVARSQEGGEPLCRNPLVSLRVLPRRAKFSAPEVPNVPAWIDESGERVKSLLKRHTGSISAANRTNLLLTLPVSSRRTWTNKFDRGVPVS